MRKVLSVDLKCTHGEHEIELPLNAIVHSAKMIRRGFVTLFYSKSWPQIQRDEIRKIQIMINGYDCPDAINRTRFIDTCIHEIPNPIIVHVFEGDLI